MGGVEKNELTRLLGARKEGVRKSVPSGANSTGIFDVEREGGSFKDLGP